MNKFEILTYNNYIIKAMNKENDYFLIKCDNYEQMLEIIEYIEKIEEGKEWENFFEMCKECMKNE